ncbi:MAG: hypothetical protein ACMXYC_03210 [Candidatus Woesearchaeota archaeon]
MALCDALLQQRTLDGESLHEMSRLDTIFFCRNIYDILCDNGINTDVMSIQQINTKLGAIKKVLSEGENIYRILKYNTYGALDKQGELYVRALVDISKQYLDKQRVRNKIIATITQVQQILKYYEDAQRIPFLDFEQK